MLWSLAHQKEKKEGQHTIGVLKHLLDVRGQEWWIGAREGCGQQASDGIDAHHLDREQMCLLRVRQHRQCRLDGRAMECISEQVWMP